MARVKISMQSSALTGDVIKRFILHCRAKGLSAKTLDTYQQHFSAIGKHMS